MNFKHATEFYFQNSVTLLYFKSKTTKLRTIAEEKKLVLPHMVHSYKALTKLYSTKSQKAFNMSSVNVLVQHSAVINDSWYMSQSHSQRLLNFTEF